MPEELDRSAAARALAAQRKIVAGHCAECGQPITGTIRRKYCGNRCAARASRRRQDAGRLTPELLKRLDETREAITHGRVFEDDSTEIIRPEPGGALSTPV